MRRFENVALEELVRYIDWMPFFNAWEFAGKFPDILTDPVVGEAASNLYADARRVLKQMVSERWVQASAVIGFFPANSVDEDIEVYARRVAQRRCVRGCITCGSRSRNRRASRITRSRISSRRASRA